MWTLYWEKIHKYGIITSGGRRQWIVNNGWIHFTNVAIDLYSFTSHCQTQLVRWMQSFVSGLVSQKILTIEVVGVFVCLATDHSFSTAVLCANKQAKKQHSAQSPGSPPFF